MKIQDLKNEIAKDIPIDPNEPDLDKVALSVPQLHNKYAIFLHDERLLLKKYLAMAATVRHRKWRYYMGKMDRDELQQFGLSPCPYKIMRADIGQYLAADQEVQDAEMLVALQEEKISFLEETLKAIHGRSFLLNTAIKNRVFMSGSH